MTRKTPSESHAGCLVDPARPHSGARGARRYAAAIAILLAAAVVPGGLPAQAGDSLLRVTNADGTVSYVNPDGQSVPAAPATAVATADPAAAPAPASPDPAPAATPS